RNPVDPDQAVRAVSDPAEGRPRSVVSDRSLEDRNVAFRERLDEGRSRRAEQRPSIEPELRGGSRRGGAHREATDRAFRYLVEAEVNDPGRAGRRSGARRRARSQIYIEGGEV